MFFIFNEAVSAIKLLLLIFALRIEAYVDGNVAFVTETLDIVGVYPCVEH